MMRRATFLISALCLLILANILMMSYASPAFLPRSEGFVSHIEKFAAAKKAGMRNQGFTNQGPRRPTQGFTNQAPKAAKAAKAANQGFQNYSGQPAGARDSYQAIGAFDGIKLDPSNGVSSWRYTSPNEPLSGNFPKFEPGPDNMFMFKDNQCKPECCGSSYSCDGGCVCTTPEQREFINHRGGNRTSPESGV